MDRRDALSISEISQGAVERLRTEQGSGSWVRGEVVAVKGEATWATKFVTIADTSGHCTLRIPRTRIAGARTDLKRGQVLEARVTPHGDSRSSSWTWDVRWLEPREEVGPMASQRARTLSRLTDEGLVVQTDVDRLRYRRSLNGVVDRQIRRVIALVPATGDDSWSDVVGVLPKGVVVDRRPVTRRGQSMAQGCTAHLRAISSDDADLVVMVRGGGTPGDFLEFDEYDLARSILECDLPVATALGHHRNKTVADLVAVRAFQTPTALAEAIEEQHRHSFRRSRTAPKRRSVPSGRVHAPMVERDTLQQRCDSLAAERNRALASAAQSERRAKRAEANLARLDDWVDGYLLDQVRRRVEWRVKSVAGFLAVAAVASGALLLAGGWVRQDVAVGIAAALCSASIVVRRMTFWPTGRMRTASGAEPATRCEWRRRAFVARGPREFRVLAASAPTRPPRSPRASSPNRFRRSLTAPRWPRPIR